MSKLDELIQQLCPDGVEWKTLGEVFNFQRGTSITAKNTVPGDVPVIAGGQTPAYYHNVANREGISIVVAGSGAYAGFVSYWEIPIFVSDAFTVNPTDCFNKRYVYHYLKNIQNEIYATKKGGGVPHVHGSSIAKFQIPVPPLPIQQEIVRILDAFTELQSELQSELQCRREQYEYYRNKLLSFEGRDDVEWKTLGDVCKTITTGKLNANAMIEDGKYPFFTCDEKPYRIDSYAFDTKAILVSGNGSRIGHINYYEGKFNAYQRTYVLSDFNGNISIKYLFFYLKAYLRKYIFSNCKKGSVPYITLPILQKFTLPIPPLEEQARIVAILDKFETLVNDLSEGLPAEIEGVREQYEYYRNQLLTFNRKEA